MGGKLLIKAMNHILYFFTNDRDVLTSATEPQFKTLLDANPEFTPSYIKKVLVEIVRDDQGQICEITHKDIPVN